MEKLPLAVAEDKKKVQLLTLCDEFYQKAKEKEGKQPNYVLVRYGGELVVISSWSSNSERILKALEEEFKND